MNFRGSKAIWVVFASFSLLVGVGVGYLAPHSQAAVAAEPNRSPDPAASDGTPGGFGHGLITIDSATTPGVTAAHVKWPCIKGDKKCTLEFKFEGSRSGPAPKVPCPQRSQSCLQFSGTGFQVKVHDGDTFGPEDVAVSGYLLFSK